MPTDLTSLVLAAGTAIVEGIQDGVRTQGFDDVRPAHGFAFVRIAAGDASVQAIADHLGMTKQAASQLVNELRRKGYVTVTVDPDDRRARIINLTERGWSCTRAADAAAEAVVDNWRTTIGAARVKALTDDLSKLVKPGPLRPAW